MYSFKIELVPYELNNINLMIHIGKENGVLVTYTGTTATCYCVDEEAKVRFIQEWKNKYDELFIYCERYKMLELPHLRIARQEKLLSMIKNYDLKNRYKKDYIKVIKGVRYETNI